RRDAELPRRDLGKDVGVPLASRLHIERQHRGPITGKLQRGAFERHAAGMLEHAGDADAAILAMLGRLALALLEAGVVRKRDRLVEDRLELAGVVSGADRGL